MPSSSPRSSRLNDTVRPVLGLRNSVVRIEPGRKVSCVGSAGRGAVTRGRLAGTRVTSASTRDWRSNSSNRWRSLTSSDSGCWLVSMPHNFHVENAQVATGAIHMASFKFPPALKIKLGLARKLSVNAPMATLVFDIETTALPLENFDEAQQEYLFREADKLGDATAKDAKREEITKFMSLWPFTSQVVCIAMLNAETQRGQTIYVSDDFEDEMDESLLAASKPGEDRVKFIPCADETELLTQFWDAAKNFNSVVTFNGRGFDVPFIYLRSALLNVPISKKNWLGYRYATH